MSHDPSISRTHKKSRALAPYLIPAAAIAGAGLLTRLETMRAERHYPPAGQFVEVDGLRLHYVDSGGHGSPIVVLHGNGAMIAEMMSSGLIDRLARRHRVLMFDRPGFGHSDRPRGEDWTPERQAELFAKAFWRLGLMRPVVLAHSWAALIALSLALDHPQSIAGLVLIGGFYFPESRMDAAILSGPAVPIVGDLVRHTTLPWIARLLAPRIIRKIFAPQPVPARFTDEFPLELALRPSQLRALGEESRMMVPAAQRLFSRYGEVSQPVVIIAGTEDRLVDFGNHPQRLVRAIPRSRLLQFPNFGHMLHHFLQDQVADATELMADKVSAMSSEVPRP